VLGDIESENIFRYSQNSLKIGRRNVSPPSGLFLKKYGKS